MKKESKYKALINDFFAEVPIEEILKKVDEIEDLPLDGLPIDDYFKQLNEISIFDDLDYSKETLFENSFGRSLWDKPLDPIVNEKWINQFSISNTIIQPGLGWEVFLDSDEPMEYIPCQKAA